MTCLAPSHPSSDLSFDDLTGWGQDDHAGLLRMFAAQAPLLSDPIWHRAMAVVSEPGFSGRNARRFFERYFQPTLTIDHKPGLLTGYFEPQFQGSRTRTVHFHYPLYAPPPGPCDLTRQAIDRDDALIGKDLELVWLACPMDVFFLQVQGSGRITLPDGTIMRIGFAGRNSHPYRSIGKWLVANGVCSAKDISPQHIRAYIDDHGPDVLFHNPSYIFFRELTGLPADTGPLGHLQVPLTPERSIAVDPGHIALGTPVWLQVGGDTPYSRLTLAQDIGAAIKGPHRADLFCGTGPLAGGFAGQVNDPVRLIALRPVQE